MIGPGIVDLAAAVIAASAAAAAVVVASAGPVVKCSMPYARNAGRKRRCPSSPAVPARSIAEIASPPTARPVVAAVVVAAVEDMIAATAAVEIVPAATRTT